MVIGRELKAIDLLIEALSYFLTLGFRSTKLALNSNIRS